MNKPHKHAALIKAWADGAEIEWHDSLTGKWVDSPDNSPTWREDITYRIKPEKECPKSSLTNEELLNVVRSTGGDYRNSYKAIADAAVKRYIQEQEEK